MKLIALFVTAVLALDVSSAAADKIVLESFTGGKTDEHARRIAPLLEALANHGFFGGYDAVGRKFEARVSRPALRRGLPADFAEQVETGHRAWIEGRFEAAIKTLDPLIEAAHANPGAFANNQGLRLTVKKALIALALAYERIGDPAQLKRTFGEVVRSFPNATMARGVYGPSAVATFERIKRELMAQGTGSLVVRSSADAAIIYINEKIEGAGPLTRERLVPGEYRVFVQVGRQVSRSHHVVIKAGERATLVVDLGFDTVVQVSPTWTGLAFETAADRERHEVAYAARFGNALDADAIAVVGIDHVHGRPAVIGALVNRVSGTEIRRASVALDPAPPSERLKALAQFLAGENLAPEGVDVLVRDERPVGITSRLPDDETPAPGEAGGGRWGGWKYVAGGGALVGLAVGGVLLARDGSCSQDLPPGATCTDLVSTATPGLIALGGGAALAAVSIYLFVKGDGGDAPARAAYVVPARGGAIAGFSARF